MVEQTEIIVKNITEGLKQDSIEITKNSKSYGWNIKKYGDMSTKENTDQLIQEIIKIENELKKHFGGIENG